MTVVRMRRARSSPSSWARRSISRTWCCASALVDDLLDEAVARLGHRQAAHPLQLDELALVELGEARALRLDGPLLLLERLLAALESLDLAIEALRPVEEEALLALEVGALLPRLVLGSALGLEGLVLALQHDLLLLGPGLGDDPFGVALRVADGGGGEVAAREVADPDADHQRSERHEDGDGCLNHGSSVPGARNGRPWRPSGGPGAPALRSGDCGPPGADATSRGRAVGEHQGRVNPRRV
jgi:hypothetical protein